MKIWCHLLPLPYLLAVLLKLPNTDIGIIIQFNLHKTIIKGESFFEKRKLGINYILLKIKRPENVSVKNFICNLKQRIVHKNNRINIK